MNAQAYRVWRVAAGRGGRHAEDFLNGNFVALGWHEMGDLTRFGAREEMLEHARSVFTSNTERQNQVGVNQIWRFLREFKLGDYVITYQPRERLYYTGRIEGDAEFRPDAIAEKELVRPVTWTGKVSRDALSQAARNSLGAIQTIIRVPDEVAAELLTFASIETRSDAAPAAMETSESADASNGYGDLAEQALVGIEDMLLRLDWEEMQQLVAALLRALGYRTVISPAGADRGKDIIASRDGFGFERPRIIVEVKHRRNERMRASDLRAFLGGRHADDRGLYVSTGGFSQDAKYEADRAPMPTHLLDLRGLAQAVVDNYEKFDEEGRALVRLRSLYWPA